MAPSILLLGKKRLTATESEREQLQSQISGYAAKCVAEAIQRDLQRIRQTVSSDTLNTTGVEASLSAANVTSWIGSLIVTVERVMDRAALEQSNPPLPEALAYFDRMTEAGR